MNKIKLVKFEVYNDGRYWCARGIGEDIFTQGENMEELLKNIKEAVEIHFENFLKRGNIKILILTEMEVPSFA